MKQELVSIITPSYNSAKFVRQTIESVLVQSYTNWEMLITDDCSTDSSVEVINEYVELDERIKLFILDKNSGAAVARNRSLEMARGKFIAFLDSDDVWKENKLSDQIRFMKENGHAFSFSSYYTMNEDGTPTGKIVNSLPKVSYRRYLRNTIIGCLTVVIDREKTGDFRMPIIRTSQDTATWLLILKRGFTAYGMSDVMAGYRLVGNSNSAKKWRAAKDVWRVYRDFEKLSFPYAAYNFVGYTLNAIIKRIF